MDIIRDIEKATQIPWTEENSLFVPVEERDTTKEAQFHRRRRPKNVNLLDNENDDSFSDTPTECSLNENEIASSIKVANGGINYSNDNIEYYWRLRQLQSSSNSKSSENNDSRNNSPVSEVLSNNTALKNSSEVSKTNTNTRDGANTDDCAEILKKCKLTKNAAIAGLLKNKLISAESLQVLSESCTSNMERTRNKTIQNDIVEDDYAMKLVPCPEDEDVLIQPLQAHGTIDENEYKDIDFTVAHVGKKKIVTPRQYYINEVDDSFFEFVKKDPNRES